jgi:hypothetical protein
MSESRSRYARALREIGSTSRGSLPLGDTTTILAAQIDRDVVSLHRTCIGALLAIVASLAVAAMIAPMNLTRDVSFPTTDSTRLE